MSPLPSNGYGRNRLPYPYSYRVSLEGGTLDYPSGQTATRNPGRNAFTLCLTDTEMLEILSALQAGADLIYPDRWQEVIDPFLNAREHPNNPNWSSPCSQEVVLMDSSSIGEVVFWPNSDAIPEGYIPCIGQTVTDATAPELVAKAVANNWLGANDFGSFQTFELPDMRNRFALGEGTRDVQDTGGEEEVTLTIAEMPAHSHDLNRRENSTAFGSLAPAGAANGPVSTSNAVQQEGGGNAHNNMPPFLAGIWVMRSKPVEFNITQFFDVTASDCMIYKNANGTQSLVLDVNQCITSSRESVPDFDQANDILDTKSDLDCVWGGVSAIVDYIVSNALELLDALESAVSATEGFFEFISVLGWWVPSARAIEVFEFVSNIAIATARLELQNEPTVDGWKCDLFCRVRGNNGTLTQGVFDAWLDNDICSNPATCAPGRLALLASAMLTPNQWLFNRYALSYADDCSSAWSSLCDCEKCVFVDDFNASPISVPTGTIQPDGSVAGELIGAGYFITITFTFPANVSVNEVQVDWQRSSSSATADLDIEVPTNTSICNYDSDPVGRRTDTCDVGGITSTTVTVRIDMPAQTEVYSLRIKYDGSDFFPSLPCP